MTKSDILAIKEIKTCENCEGFIPKSKNIPFNAFDYIAGNVVGVCNFTEDVMSLSRIINVKIGGIALVARIGQRESPY